MGQDVSIYCVCFPKHEPYRRQRYQQDIMCNANTLDPAEYEALKTKGYVFDNTGDHISDLNWTLGDLTASYWIWKNSDHEFVGTSQYRRFWGNSVYWMNFKKDTLYVQKPFRFRAYNLREQYIACHGEEGVRMLDELAAKGQIPLTPSMLEKAYEVNYLHSCNMFIARKDIYDAFCSLLMETVFKVHEIYGDEIKQLSSYNRRTPAFLAERIVTALVVNKDHFFDKLDVEQLKWSLKEKPAKGVLARIC